MLLMRLLKKLASATRKSKSLSTKGKWPNEERTSSASSEMSGQLVPLVLHSFNLLLRTQSKARLDISEGAALALGFGQCTGNWASSRQVAGTLLTEVSSSLVI